MPVCTAESAFNKSAWPPQSALRHFNVEDVRAEICTMRDDEFPGERMGLDFGCDGSGLSIGNWSSSVCAAQGNASTASSKSCHGCPWGCVADQNWVVRKQTRAEMRASPKHGCGGAGVRPCFVIEN
jgi:hypothetical protein